MPRGMQTLYLSQQSKVLLAAPQAFHRRTSGELTWLSRTVLCMSGEWKNAQV